MRVPLQVQMRKINFSISLKTLKKRYTVQETVKKGTATMLLIETGLPIAKFDLFMKVC